MKSLLVSLVALGMALVCVNGAVADEVITIKVSPNVINIANETTQWVTVHTDIAYGAVAEASVTLNGVEIAWSKADLQGNFVAKFVAGEVKALVELDAGEKVTLTLVLSGITKEGVPFSGSQDLTVMNVGPKK